LIFVKKNTPPSNVVDLRKTTWNMDMDKGYCMILYGYGFGMDTDKGYCMDMDTDMDFGIYPISNARPHPT